DDGTPLTWKVIPASGPGPHPAVLVIHGGHFAKTPVSPNSVRAAHDLAATGSKGDDRLDAGVGLSGAYDLADLASSPRGIIRRKIENYVGSSSPEAVRKASPLTYI